MDLKDFSSSDTVPADKLVLVDQMRNWDSMNRTLMQADLSYAQRMLIHEQQNKRRPSFIRRIYSRVRRLRILVEREQIEARISEHQKSFYDIFR